MLELQETASRALHPRHCSPPVATLTVPWQKAVSRQHPRVPTPPASPQQRAAPCSRWDGPFIDGMGMKKRRVSWRISEKKKTGEKRKTPPERSIKRCRQSHPRRIERPRHHSLADFSCRDRPGTDSTDTGLLKIPRSSPRLQPFAAVCAVSDPLQHGMAVQWQLKRRSHKESSRC